MNRFFAIITIYFVKILRAEQIPFPVNETFIEIREAPYTAAIYVHEFYRCTGSYIRALWVLTSGYCIVGMLPGDVDVVMGTKKLNDIGEKKDVVQLVLHPDYNAVPLMNDVGLLSLSAPFTIGDTIQRIKISDKPINTTMACNLIGWGAGINFTMHLFRTDPIMLRKAEMKLIKHENCIQKLGNQTRRYGADFINPNVICAEAGDDGDACFGDVGAPLVCGDVQAGITSLVIEECGAGKPSLYTDVAKFRKWINAVTTPVLSVRSAGFSGHRCSTNFIVLIMFLSIVLDK